MSRPRDADWLKLKRVAKYLAGARRIVQMFEWQEAQHHLHTYIDSDWASDNETRRFTSAAAIAWGFRTLKIWSTTRTAIALSSGEAGCMLSSRAWPRRMES